MNRYPCGRIRNCHSRRQWLSQAACGFGSLGLAALIHRTGQASDQAAASPAQAARPGHLATLHHEAKAKRVIFLYMDGGPAQMDTFDPKPMLSKYHGQPFPMKAEPTQFDKNGSTLESPWSFARHGDSGLWISSLFPHLSRHADRLAVIRSMTSQFSEHTSANYFLHTGLGIAGRPSMGAWLSYGLGSESENLPDYVVINGGLTPPGGLENFASGFLPAAHQASLFTPTPTPIANLASPTKSAPARVAQQRDLLARLDAQYLAATGQADAVESAIENFELAYAMQSSVPEAADFASESAATLAMYGIGSANKPTDIFGRECLMARRLVERGVRMIELTCPSVGHDRWDQHANLRKGHEDNARAVDQPIAGLLADLAARGLLEDTLVVWAGEFGRTPFAQGTNGRDHNPFAFSIWMAGGGVRGGMTYGETDEFGYKVADKPVEMHDLHATILHLLGIDHERLTYRFGGRDHRLTDVHGHVVRDILI
ncbi:MAG: DUF1501 domain-containing protein [Pirellulaceae bacterium]|nr:DUF1501 domain-containing protein [Pirellulaceae bacterium]